MRNLEQDLSNVLQNSVQDPLFSFEEIWSKYEYEQPSKESKKTARWWIGVAIPAIFVLGGVTAVASTVLSNYTKNLRATTHARGVFEYVNGVPVTNEQLQAYKVGQELVAQMNHQALPSNAEVVHQLNLQQVVYQEAQKEHLVVTDEQALNFALQMQQTMEHPPADASKTNFYQNEQILKAEEKGYGVSDKQYWVKVAPQAYKVALSVVNLKRHFISAYQASHQGVSFQTAQAAWTNYENLLLKQATIKQVSK